MQQLGELQLCKSIWSKVFDNICDASKSIFSETGILFSAPQTYIPFTLRQVFNNLIELVTSCGNYSQYRKRFSECSGFRFPILGVHLKDLIAVHVALPDWADKEKTRVNLAKTQQLYAILQELALIQATPPNVDANTDLLNLLTVGIKFVPSPREMFGFNYLPIQKAVKGVIRDKSGPESS